MVGAQGSVPGVFAAGDCTTAPYQQILISMGSGATASLAAFDHLIRSTVPAASAVSNRPVSGLLVSERSLSVQ